MRGTDEAHLVVVQVQQLKRGQAADVVLDVAQLVVVHVQGAETAPGEPAHGVRQDKSGWELRSHAHAGGNKGEEIERHSGKVHLLQCGQRLWNVGQLVVADVKVRQLQQIAH